MYFGDDDKSKGIEEVAQQERDKTQDDDERILNSEGNPLHPSLLKHLKNKKKRKDKK